MDKVNHVDTPSVWNIHLGEEALGGFAAGIVGTVIGFPLDVIKTRLQTESITINRSNGAISHGGGIVRVATHIVRAEGILSLYKGITPPLISLSLINTISFASYSYFRQFYHGTNGWDLKNSLAGMTGAPMFAMITTPENFLKTQMQLDNVHNPNKRQFRGSLHCATTLVKQHGFPILYTGHVINTVREGAFMACYFFMYEGLREWFLNSSHSKDRNAKIAVPVAGGLAGACAWFFSFPLDCIRAGVQGQSLSTFGTDGRNLQAKQGAVRVFWELLNKKGVLGLYRGVGPSIARAFLVSGSRFSAYEGALWLLRGGRDNI